MKLLKSYLIGNVKRMNDNNVRMNYIGRTNDLPAEVQETMPWAMESTAKNTGTTLTLALTTEPALKLSTPCAASSPT